MKFLPSKKWLLALTPWLVLLGFVGIRFDDPDFVQRLRLKVFDYYQQTWPRQDPQHPVYVVDIDEKSLEFVGQWPWPRTKIAELVQKTFEEGAAALAFDIVFAEPDNTSPENIKKLWELDQEISDALSLVPPHDMIFARTVGRYPVVVGQVFSYENEIPGNKSELELFAKGEVVGDENVLKKSLIEAKGVVRNLAGLEARAPGVGHFTFLPEQDNIVRRIPMMVNYKGEYFPSLALELLRVGIQEDQIVIEHDQESIQGIKVGDFYLPTDEKGKFWIHFRKYHMSRYISASDILDGSLPEGMLDGALVFVGTSAAGLLDLRATPVDPLIAGVDAHVQALETILSKQFLYRPGWLNQVELLLIFMLGGGMVLFAGRFGAIKSGTAALTIISLAIFLCFWAFREKGFLIDFGFLTVSLLSVFMVQNFLRYAQEEASRKAIRSAFGHYLSPTLVSMLANSPEKLVLGGAEKEMTILFSDIRSFTTISEGLAPEELTTFINEYLTPMTDIVLDHQGTIDKYMGDAIMAFWNAPLDINGHAREACQTALVMMDRLEELNVIWKERGMPRIDIGVGINTGLACVGNMGSTQRFDYTVLGDAVNLGARLEGLSKMYGVAIVVSEEVTRQVKDGFFLPLDLVTVKGKTEPVAIFALLGLKDVNEVQKEEILNGGKAMAAYRKKKWDDAEKFFNKLVEHDKLKELYLERIREYRKTPPPSNWDGAYIATSK